MALRPIGAALLALALLASCGSDREEGASTTTAASASSSDDDRMFGDLPSPCGDGDGGGATDQGVTESEIHIGYGDDAGFSVRPGLNKEMSDAMRAMIEWCNEQGGINGRKVVGTYYDAKFTEVVNAYTDACGKEFFLVGQLFAADDTGEAKRRECELPTVPGSAVSFQLANGPLMVQGSPNPVDFTTLSEADPLIELYPEEIKAAGTMLANVPSAIANANKVVPALIEKGFDFTCKVEYSILGEADWKPFVQRLKQCGAEFVYFAGTAVPNFLNILEAAAQLDYDPVWLTDQNNYDTQFAKSNTTGYADKVHMRLTRAPLQEADDFPALQDYIAISRAAGFEPSYTGELSVSAFLLWATATEACGADLTRECVMEELHKVHKWTGGGIQAEADPGANLPSKCGMLVKLTGTKFERLHPEEPGVFACDPENVVEVFTPDRESANLDENRIAHPS